MQRPSKFWNSQGVENFCVAYKKEKVYPIKNGYTCNLVAISKLLENEAFFLIKTKEMISYK